MALAVQASAKLNLDLAVLARREDGQHEIRTTFQAVSLHDLLLVERAEQTRLELEGLPIPPSEGNLVLRAAAALEAAAGRPLPARWRLAKRIPAGAGLGGGSSDAAAALVVLSRLYGLEIDLAPLAAGLGADVPFFLAGGTAVGTGCGEMLQPIPARGGWFAIAWPGYGVSTAAVYRAWDRCPGRGVNQLQEAALLVEPRLRGFAERLGPAWRMTGSGAAFFCEAPGPAQAQVLAAGAGGWAVAARALPSWR